MALLNLREDLVDDAVAVLPARAGGDQGQAQEEADDDRDEAGHEQHPEGLEGGGPELARNGGVEEPGAVRLRRQQGGAGEQGGSAHARTSAVTPAPVRTATAASARSAGMVRASHPTGRSRRLRGRARSGEVRVLVVDDERSPKAGHRCLL